MIEVSTTILLTLVTSVLGLAWKSYNRISDLTSAQALIAHDIKAMVEKNNLNLEHLQDKYGSKIETLENLVSELKAETLYIKAKYVLHSDLTDILKRVELYLELLNRPSKDNIPPINFTDEYLARIRS